MKCIISGSNIKILAKAIHALAKIGDEMYVQPQEDSISFRAVSMSNSAYANFTMFKNYFSYYTFGDLQDEDTLKCKISMRCAIGVFKAPHVMDKVLETCHIKLDPNASIICFILKYKNSIIKTHRLPILDCETIKAAYKKDGLPNQLSAQAKVLLDVTQNFPQNMIEITLEVTPQKVLLRNYVDETTHLSHGTRTQIVLGVGEFDHYTIGSNANVTFCLKELRAILAFAEIVNLPINVNFEDAGRPVVFVLKNPSFEANLVLSTLNPEVENQTLPSPSVNVGLKKKTTTKRSSNKTSKTVSKSSKSKNSIKNNQTTKSSSHNKNTLEEERISMNSVQQDIFGENHVRQSTQMKINSRESLIDSSSSSNSIVKRTNSALQTLFPPISRRKSNPGGSNQRNDDDIIPCSPPRQPSKKARLIFQKCFKATYDPRMMLDHEEVLAKDSDEET
ncbi:cell cycle checkpoint control protein RAD9A [Leptopilina boulardi]|uniref:cell cycle checkpoint control protein RAD9A n=1 Tax=Leptopilina boulardi TaxID=63433 RepID=UPI0021F65FCE|nr:cell cycle checkpoint control protein RAD9A [Leptopilina boulardi]